MKRATGLPSYRNAEPFTPPPGIVTVPIETQATLSDSPDLPATQSEIFIQGTQPPSPVESLGEALIAQEEVPPEDPPNGAQPQEGQRGEDPAQSETIIPVSESPKEVLQPEKTTPTNPPVEDTPSGRLRIETGPPGLEVFIDGKLVGLSPMTVWLPVGEHIYKVAPPPGAVPAESTVQITTTDIANVNIRYRPK